MTVKDNSSPPISSFELQRLDDRTLKDIGVRRCEIGFAVRNGLPTRVSRKARQRAWSSAPPQRRAA